MLLAGCQAAPGGEKGTNPVQTQAALPSATRAAADTPTPLAATPTVEIAQAVQTITPTTSTTPTPAGPTPTATAIQVSVTTGKAMVPILLYHHISDDGNTRYITKVDAFRAQMETLKKEGYATITISQLADVIRGGEALPNKPVALTFDDGYLDTYENAFPILRELGFTATVYVITGTLGTKLSYGYMQEKELKELAAAGWEIGSHSVTHSSLLTSKLGIGNEMKQSKADLEKKLGVKVRSFSYPFGIVNAWIEERAAENRYDSAVGLNDLMTHTTERLFDLNRREVHRGITAQQFEALLQPGEGDYFVATLIAETQTPKP